MTAVMWFRRDLRIHDNPALGSALATGEDISCIFVRDPTLLAGAGRFRLQALDDAIEGLEAQLNRIGLRLELLDGASVPVLRGHLASVRPSSLHMNTDVSPYSRQRDTDVITHAHYDVVSHWGSLVHAPGTVLTARGTISRVFTAFHKRWQMLPVDETTDLPHLNTIADTSTLGEALWLAQLDDFDAQVDRYADDRDTMAHGGTSRLGVGLRFGTLSPRRVLCRIGGGSPGRDALARQLAWRDWYAHLMWETPDLATKAMRAEYDEIEWNDDHEGFASWTEGQTGYPVVDAAMRQLAATGWMHNRARMIAASFLVKDLMIDWRKGERHFAELLSDFDPAQNAGNWQWVAGTGPDAAPYFRIFNPVTQGRKFDPDGDYIRRWVPELAALDNTTIHAPWEAAPLDLLDAGVSLGDTYPAPLVDHAFARGRALARYREALAGRD